MGNETYGPLTYRDNEGNRQVVTTGGKLQIDGGILEINTGALTMPVREAYICGSCGDLPISGTAVLGNSSAAIIRYQLPVPESSYLGSELKLHAIAFDDTINSSTHWYVAGTSGNSWAVGVTTATNGVIWDSTYEQAFTIYVQAHSTNLWKVFLPGTTGALTAGLLLGTTLTT